MGKEPGAGSGTARQLSLFPDEKEMVLNALMEVDTSRLSPLAALNLLHEWQGMLGAKGK